jgi:hypothetical protein
MAIGRPISLTPNVKSKKISVTATASQTLFTVQGGYRVNAISVYRNGVRLAQNKDFTAGDGSTVTLLSAATVGDVIAFEIFDTFPLADAINANSSDQTISGNLTVTGSLDVQTAATNKGAYVGIISGDYNVGSAKTLKFVGTGNTFSDNGDGSVSISISGGGGGLGKPVNDTDSIFNYIERYKTVTESITLDTTNSGLTTAIVVTTNPRIVVADSKTVTVGAAKTLVVDILNIDNLFDA